MTDTNWSEIVEFWRKWLDFYRDSQNSDGRAITIAIAKDCTVALVEAEKMAERGAVFVCDDAKIRSEMLDREELALKLQRDIDPSKPLWMYKKAVHEIMNERAISTPPAQGVDEGCGDCDDSRAGLAVCKCGRSVWITHPQDDPMWMRCRYCKTDYDYDPTIDSWVFSGTRAPESRKDASDSEGPA